MDRTKQTSRNFGQQYHCLPPTGKWLGRKNALAIESFPHGRLTGPKWMDELPMVLLGIQTVWRQDAESSPADGTALHLPGEFFNAPRTSDMHSGFLRELQNSMHSALLPLPNYHGTRPTYIPSDLEHTGFVYIRHGAHRNLLQRPYAGPFPVLERMRNIWSLIVMAK